MLLRLKVLYLCDFYLNILYNINWCMTSLVHDVMLLHVRESALMTRHLYFTLCAL